MGTIRWIDSQGGRNPGDTNRSTIGAYMLEFSRLTFNLNELCLKDYGKGLTLSTKQSKSSIMVPRLRDMGTAMILRCHVTLNHNTDTTHRLLGLMKSTSESKQLYQNTTEVYSISEARQPNVMGILMLLGMGKLNGTIVVNGLELLPAQQVALEWRTKAIDFFNSTLNHFGMLLGMLRFAICSLHLAL